MQEHLTMMVPTYLHKYELFFPFVDSSNNANIISNDLHTIYQAVSRVCTYFFRISHTDFQCFHAAKIHSDINTTNYVIDNRRIVNLRS